MAELDIPTVVNYFQGIQADVKNHLQGIQAQMALVAGVGALHQQLSDF